MAHLIVYLMLFGLISLIVGILIYKVIDFFVDIFKGIINSLL